MMGCDIIISSIFFCQLKFEIILIIYNIDNIEDYLLMEYKIEPIK